MFTKLQTFDLLFLFLGLVKSLHRFLPEDSEHKTERRSPEMGIPLRRQQDRKSEKSEVYEIGVVKSRSARQSGIVRIETRPDDAGDPSRSDSIETRPLVGIDDDLFGLHDAVEDAQGRNRSLFGGKDCRRRSPSRI